MNPLLELRCKRLIIKFRKMGVHSFRDELFELCKTEIIRYIKFSLKKYKRYESQPQILSLAYDVFLVALEKYTLGEDFTNHLSDCAKSEVRKFCKKDKRVKGRDFVCYEDESVQSSTELTTNPFYAMEGYISLKDFRKFLPDIYQTVLDDSILSFDNTRRFRQTRPINCPLAKHRYYEAKRVLRFVAEFFLRG